MKSILLNPNNSLGRHSGEGRNPARTKTRKADKIVLLPHVRGKLSINWIPAFAGMTQFCANGFSGLRKFIFLIALAALPVSESLAAAGKFNFVIGDVSVVGASGSRKAVRGGEVEANESIVSGKDGMAQLRMSDGAFIAVRADTELRIETYKYSGKADASSESVLSLVKGTFRAFTGAIASFNKDKFKMKTPSATIGIRGSGNVLNFSPVDNLTLNHTIEGSHVVTAFDPSGALRTLVTMPGQTVQINAVGAMQLVQTPTFILNAAAGVPDSKPQQQPRQQQNQQPGAGEHGQAPGQGGAPGEGGGAAAGGPGMPGAPGMVAPGMMPRAGGMRAPGMPGMYAEGGEGAGDPAMAGRAPGQPGMYNPAMPGGAPAIDPVTGMPMAPAPGMYGAAPMPGMYPPAPGMPGTYGAPMIDPATGMPMPPAPGMYGAPAPMPGMYGTPAPMPGMYPPAAGMPYSDPAMMGGGAPGMYGVPAPMPGMYPPAAGMPGGMYTDPAMMGGGAIGMYGAPAPMPGMYNPAMPGMPAPGMYDPAMPGMYGAAPMPGMYPPAPMPGMYPPAPGMPGGMYTDPAMMGMYAPAQMPGMPAPGTYTDPAMMGMYAPAPGIYNPAMPAGTTYTTYDPMTGMTMTTYVPPPTTYIAQYGYDAMGNLLPGYVLMNGIPTLQTAARYGYQYDFYGNLVLMPGFALDMYGNPYPTGAIARYGFDASGLLLSGYFMDDYGNPYPSGNPPPYGYTHDFYGNLVMAPGFMRDAYGNVVMMGAAAGTVGWLGGTCTGYMAPGGMYCDPATNTFMSMGGTTYTVGWLGGTCMGYSTPPGAYCDPATNTFVSAGGGTTYLGGACTGIGNVSGTLYCDGAMWIMPVAGSFCTGAATVGSMTCSGGYWTYMGGAVVGGICTGAGGVSGALYCDGMYWVYPTLGTSCVGTATVSGMTCSGGWWATQSTYATPGFAAPPAPGWMWDAFGVQVTIPATYKNVGYMYNLSGNFFEMALNNTTTIGLDGNGMLTSFQLPLGGGTSTNGYQLDMNTAVQMDFGTDFMTGMSWGRWQGGSVNQTMLPSVPTPISQAGNSLHWFSTGSQTQAVTLPVTGTWNYIWVGGTSPTDNAGTVGVLTGASFSANFSVQTVNVGVNVSMPASPMTSAQAVTLNANALNVPILAGGNFKTNAPAVTCAGAGCAGPVSGVIGGQFSAPNGSGVGVGYGLNNGAQTVNGVAVFHQ